VVKVSVISILSVI